jgi:hypothetical protein
MNEPIAISSIMNPLAHSWLISISHTLTSYEDFKSTFMHHFWSREAQSLARCSIYTNKYSKQSGDKMSAHFLKYAVLATYLEPSIPDRELISTLQFHFPPFIQIILATAPLQRVQDAVDILKRYEMMANHDPGPKPNPVPPTRDNPSCSFQSRGNDRTEDANHFVRQTYYLRGSNFTRNGPNSQNTYTRNRADFGKNAGRYGEPSQMPQPLGLQDMNPNAPAFRQNPRQDDSNDHSRQGNSNFVKLGLSKVVGDTSLTCVTCVPGQF